jgi:hypothetical protein
VKVSSITLFLFSSLILPHLSNGAANSASPSCVYKMRNQAATSTCWLHSALQMMDRMAGTPLSVDALLIPEIKSRALDRYLGEATPWDGGAGPTRPFALALEHGLVPEAVWQKDSLIVKNFGAIFSQVEKLLARKALSRGELLAQVENIIRGVVGDLPPEEFEWQGRRWTAVEYAQSVIGTGASMGYDFRDVKYDESIYGRMPEIAWTTIISRSGDLIKITDIIKKQVVRLTPDMALAKAAEIFASGRPVAFTFIWADHDGRTVVSLNQNKEYISVRPPTRATYTSSHLVLVTNILREGNRVVGLQVLDPLARDLQSGTRIVTAEFFNDHGKTIHEIRPASSCSDVLKTKID